MTVQAGHTLRPVEAGWKPALRSGDVCRAGPAGSRRSYLVGGEEEPEGVVKTETLEDIRCQLEEISARLERLERRE